MTAYNITSMCHHTDKSIKIAETKMRNDVETKDKQPKLHIEQKNKELYNDSNQLLVDTVYDTISIRGVGYEKAAEAIGKWSAKNEATILAETEEYFQYLLETQGQRSYTINEKIEATRNDNRVISFTKKNNTYSGGAHGNYGTWGYNFDAQTGIKLSIADIVNDFSEFTTAANEYLFAELEKGYGEGLWKDYKETIKAMWKENDYWYFNDSGITIIFNPYEVGPYAMGDVMITLPYDVFEAYIEEQYRIIK